MITLDDEVGLSASSGPQLVHIAQIHLVWSARWSIAKALFLINRYLMFVGIILDAIGSSQSLVAYLPLMSTSSEQHSLHKQMIDLSVGVSFELLSSKFNHVPHTSAALSKR